MQTPPPPVEFFVPVTPEATGNAHYVQRRGPACPRCKRKPNVSVGRKESAKRLKRTIQVYAAQHRPRSPWEGPVYMDLVLALPMPVSFLKWQREAALLGYITPIVRGCGDRDNFLKALADSLEKAFYIDDSQVDRGPLSKIYAEWPGYRVSLRYLPMQPSSAAEWRRIKKGLEETCDAIETVAHPDDAFL